MKKNFNAILRFFFSNKPVVFWIFILLGELFYFMFLTGNHLFPHLLDGFQYFHVQYYFLNHQIIYNETPFWIPYLSHGTVSTWWNSTIADLPFLILTAVAPVFGKLLSHVNFLTIFHAEEIFMELILALGAWLLCKRYRLSNVTAFYASFTAVTSSIWLSQPWWNFHQYYALPLIFVLGHRFLDTGRWRYLFLCGNLTFLQTLGNLGYFIPVTTMTIGVYFMFWIFLRRRETFPQIRNLKISWKTLLCFAGIALSLWAAYGAITANTSELRLYTSWRNADLSMSARSFLLYACNTNLKKWLELFFGVSPFIDMTLFFGYFPIFFLGVGIVCSRERMRYPLLALTLFLILFSMATPLSEAMFYLWPGMKYFRHLGLIAPVIKIFLIILSAFGLEYLLSVHEKPSKKSLCLATAAGILLFTSVLIVCGHWLSDPPAAVNFFKGLVEDKRPIIAPLPGEASVMGGLLNLVDPEKIPGQIILSSSCLFLSLLMMIALSASIASKHWKLLLMICLELHVVTLFYYKIMETQKRTLTMPEKLSSITRFTPMPYQPFRIPQLDVQDLRDEILPIVQPTYASVNMFVFQDELGQFYRVDHFLQPLNNYMKAYWHQDIADNAERPLGMDLYSSLEFPVYHQAAKKISGSTRPKIQFFSNAYKISDDKTSASIIARADYKGDILFLTTDEPNDMAFRGRNLALDANERLSLKPEITFFNANHLIMDVEVPPENPVVWLHYADIFNPLWTAAINGKSTKIYRSNMAYKAIPLSPGKNNIHFKYYSPALDLIYRFWQVMSLFWLFYLGKLFRGMIREENLK